MGAGTIPHRVGRFIGSLRTAPFFFLLLLGCATTIPERNVALVATAADVATTIKGVNSGYVESNPVYGSRNDTRRILVVNLAITGAIWWLTKDMDIKTQRTVWRWVAGFRIGATCWNTAQITNGGK